MDLPCARLYSCSVCRADDPAGRIARKALAAGLLKPHALVGPWPCPFGVGPVTSANSVIRLARVVRLGDRLGQAMETLTGRQPCHTCLEVRRTLNGERS